MQQQTTLLSQSQSHVWWLSSRALVAWWIIGGAGLVFAIGVPPVQRTQEARVLEAAREMPGNGWRGWMLPHLNGNLRLRKPPLAYWLAAGAYEIGGVSEGIGRIPTVLLAWLTVGLTYACASWLFDRRTGFFAAGCLLCSYLFFRYTRLAETDAPAMFFVTLGVFAFWKALGQTKRTQLFSCRREKGTQLFWSASAVWFHVAAAATGGAILSKGPPGAYPPLFFVAMVALTRRWNALWRFVVSGAPLTLIILAAPWFVYVFHTVGVAQWLQELHELEGEDHPGHFWQYFYQLFIAAAPWCVLLPAALVAAARERRDVRVAGLVAWLAVILLPLCFVGNKQFHYLLPLMPPIMILIGWWIDRALTEGKAALIDVTIVGSVLAIPAILVTARLLAGRISGFDWALAAWIAALLLCVLLINWRISRAAGATAYIGAVLLVFVPVVGLWMPRTEQDDSRQIARQISARYGNGPYCFYGPNYSLPLCFCLRSIVPQVKTASELEQLAMRQPTLVVIVQTKSKFTPPPVPAGFEEQMQIARPKQLFQIFRHHAAETNSPS